MSNTDIVTILTNDNFCKPISGFEGYSISFTGQVFSTKRGTLKRLALTSTNHGHVVSNLSRSGKKFSIYVHTAVLEAFVGPRPEGMIARHLDGNCANNHVSNLEWCTPQVNAADRVRHGRRTVLSPTDVQNIRLICTDYRTADGKPFRLTYKTVARMYGITARYVSRIVNRTAYEEVPDAEIPHFEDGVLVRPVPDWQPRPY